MAFVAMSSLFRRLVAVGVLLQMAGNTSAGVEAEKLLFNSLDGVGVSAWLFRPVGNSLPTVVALHGCGGLYSNIATRTGALSARHQAMADRLVAQGYAVIFPDSLTPRGAREICTQKNSARTIKQAERRRDTLAALAWVVAQPWADPKRVAVLGWSNGGSAVLSSTDLKNSDVRESSHRFVTAIAFYPGCVSALKEQYRPNTQLTMLVGALDDWTAPQPCERLANESGAKVVVYPGAYHGFDSPSGKVVHRTDVPNGVNPGQGVHVGPHPEAREQSNELVLSILKSAFSEASPSISPIHH